MNEDIKSYLSIPIGGGKNKKCIVHQQRERKHGRRLLFCTMSSLSITHYLMTEHWLRLPLAGKDSEVWKS